MQPNKKTLAVCGDSFMSVCDLQHKEQTMETYAGTHWSEVVSERMDMNLLNLAIPGSSTATIIFQLLQAIKMKADCIVIANSASTGRHEYFYKNEFGVEPPRIPTIKDFYFGKSRSNPFTSDSPIIPTIESYGTSEIPNEQFKNFMLINFPLQLSDIKENWMFVYGLDKLVKSKIPFLVFEGRATSPWANAENQELLDFCKEENIIYTSDFDPYCNRHSHGWMPPNYHTSIEEQVRIANYMETRIKTICQ